MHAGSMPCEYEDRDWGDMSTNQGMPKIGSKSPEAGERHGTDSTSQLSAGTNPANTSIVKF